MAASAERQLVDGRGREAMPVVQIRQSFLRLRFRMFCAPADESPWPPPRQPGLSEMAFEKVYVVRKVRPWLKRFSTRSVPPW